jgi:hypothetical protein
MGTILDQLVAEVEAYPLTDMQVEVLDLSFADGEINVNDVEAFRIRVTNHGPLTVTQLRLKVTGLNGALVRAGVGSAFDESFITDELDELRGHGGSIEFGLPYFQAPPEAQDLTALMSITVETYWADDNHIWGSHSQRADVAGGTFAGVVKP